METDGYATLNAHCLRVRQLAYATRPRAMRPRTTLGYARAVQYTVLYMMTSHALGDQARQAERCTYVVCRTACTERTRPSSPRSSDPSAATSLRHACANMTVLISACVSFSCRACLLRDGKGRGLSGERRRGCGRRGRWLGRSLTNEAS
jgi:hypothetical protein